jgi:hypothetical protein
MFLLSVIYFYCTNTQHRKKLKPSAAAADGEEQGLTAAEVLAIKRRRELCEWLEALLGSLFAIL